VFTYLYNLLEVDKKVDHVKISGAGSAIPIVVSIARLVRTKLAGIHSFTTIENQEIEEEKR
jgi:DNA-binding protein